MLQDHTASCFTVEPERKEERLSAQKDWLQDRDVQYYGPPATDIRVQRFEKMLAGPEDGA